MALARERVSVVLSRDERDRVLYGDLPALPRYPLAALLRPRQWVKNALVLAPLLFGGLFLEPSAVVAALGATLVFCGASSASYVLNDLRDVYRDRNHPTKRWRRPLASGQLGREDATLALSGLGVVVGAGIGAMPILALPVVGYLVLTTSYSLRLKEVPVVDLFALAGGFLLRVWAGALVLGLTLSPWMLTTTLCLALYLAVTKRRQELARNGADARPVLNAYPDGLLERYGQLAAIGAVVFYGLYAATVRPELAITVPAVLFGVFRFSWLVEQGGDGESPTDVLFRDAPLAIAVAAWAALTIVALWPS